MQKLNGKTIDYNLYLEIASNKWKVKLVRIYLDYPFKVGKVNWEEGWLKPIFKVEKGNDSYDKYKIDVGDLIERAINMS